LTVVIIIGCAILVVLIAISLMRQREQRAADKHAKAEAYTGEVEARQDASRQIRERVRADYAASHAAPAGTAVSDADE
jgi:hypothetical protein